MINFDAESKSAKIPNSLYDGGREVGDNQLPTFDAESKSAKIPNSLYGGSGGVGLVMTNFQLLMLCPNMLKSQIPYMVRGGGGGNKLFDAESKSAKIPNSLYGGGEWGGWKKTTTFSKFQCWHLVRV